MPVRPTEAEAVKYVAAMEAKWGLPGSLTYRAAPSTALPNYGIDVFTANNHWTVWYEQYETGVALYGEC